MVKEASHSKKSSVNPAGGWWGGFVLENFLVSEVRKACTALRAHHLIFLKLT